MGNTPAVRVEGLGKVLRQIKQIDPDLVAELKIANRAIADDVVLTARALAPQKTGKLKGSARAGASNRTGIVRAGGARVPWAGPIHFGWKKRNISPQPFLYDALDERRDEVEQRYLAALNEITRKID
jgi:hypothetical protein